MPTGSAPSRTDRLEEGCRRAIAEIEDLERRDDPDIFIPLGHALFWLFALADTNKKGNIPLLAGTKWARNRVAHGAVVSAPVVWHDGAEVGRMKVGPGGGLMGSRSGHKWLLRAQVPLGPADKPNASQEVAYDAQLAGKYVLPTLRAALVAAS